MICCSSYTDSQKKMAGSWPAVGWSMLMRDEDPILASNYGRKRCLNITHFLGHLCILHHPFSPTSKLSHPDTLRPQSIIHDSYWPRNNGGSPLEKGTRGEEWPLSIFWFFEKLSYGEIVVGFNAVTYSVSPDELESPFQLYHSSRQEHVTLFISSFQQAA